jgi:hypothetical protein
MWRPEDLMVCELQLLAGDSPGAGEPRVFRDVGQLDETYTSLTERS